MPSTQESEMDFGTFIHTSTPLYATAEGAVPPTNLSPFQTQPIPIPIASEPQGILSLSPPPLFFGSSNSLPTASDLVSTPVSKRVNPELGAVESSPVLPAREMVAERARSSVYLDEIPDSDAPSEWSSPVKGNSVDREDVGNGDVDEALRGAVDGDNASTVNEGKRVQRLGGERDEMDEMSVVEEAIATGVERNEEDGRSEGHLAAKAREPAARRHPLIGMSADGEEDGEVKNGMSTQITPEAGETVMTRPLLLEEKSTPIITKLPGTSKEDEEPDMLVVPEASGENCKGTEYEKVESILAESEAVLARLATCIQDAQAEQVTSAEGEVDGKSTEPNSHTIETPARDPIESENSEDIVMKDIVPLETELAVDENPSPVEPPAAELSGTLLPKRKSAEISQVLSDEELERSTETAGGHKSQLGAGVDAEKLKETWESSVDESEIVRDNDISPISDSTSLQRTERRSSPEPQKPAALKKQLLTGTEESQDKDILMAELKAMKIASIQARNAALEAEIIAKRAKLEEVTKELTQPAAETVRRHIKLLHDYNDIRDVGQGLIGMIAENRGVRIGELYEEFGVGLKD